MSLVTLTVVPDEVEAEMIQGMLAANGVAATYRKTNMAAGWSTGVLSPGGPIEVLVAAEDEERARAMLPQS